MAGRAAKAPGRALNENPKLAGMRQPVRVGAGFRVARRLVCGGSREDV